MPLPFKLPLDAYVLAIPIAYASAAFTVMIARQFTHDPESTNLQFYTDEQSSAKVAQTYDNQFKSLFDSRVRTHKTGVFTNWFEGTRQ